MRLFPLSFFTIPPPCVYMCCSALRTKTSFQPPQAHISLSASLVWEQTPPQRPASEHRVELRETGQWDAHGLRLPRERNTLEAHCPDSMFLGIPRWASLVFFTSETFFLVVPPPTNAHLGRTFLLVSWNQLLVPWNWELFLYHFKVIILFCLIPPPQPTPPVMPCKG